MVRQERGIGESLILGCNFITRVILNYLMLQPGSFESDVALIKILTIVILFIYTVYHNGVFMFRLRHELHMQIIF